MAISVQSYEELTILNADIEACCDEVDVGSDGRSVSIENGTVLASG